MSSKAAIQTCGSWLAAMTLMTGSALGQFDDLVQRVPAGANALVLVDSAALSKTAMVGQLRNKYASHPLIYPPQAAQVVLAAKLNPTMNLQSEWEVALLNIPDGMSVDTIATSEKGYVDTVNGLQAVWTPGNLYYVELEPHVLGITFPADRQELFRWTSHSENSHTSALSPYLSEAARDIDTAGQIVTVLDLTSAIQPHIVRDRLDHTKLASEKGVDLDHIAGVLLGLRGVTLSIKVDGELAGKLSIDFDQDVTFLAPYAKDLFLDALDQFGAVVHDFENWKVQTVGKSVVMQGDLSDDGARRLASFLEMPSTQLSTQHGYTGQSTAQSSAASSSQAEASPSGNTADEKLKATQKYFNSLNDTLADLRRSWLTNKQNPALWLGRYARQIDRLPTLNVDEELLAFGTQVAEGFRKASVSQLQAGIQTGVQTSALGAASSHGGGYRVSRSGVSRANREFKRDFAIREQQMAGAMQVRIQQMQSIEDAWAKVRIQLTSKYGVQF